ncbi:MAG: HNH endonuclease [Spirochaetaceae bacterium]
MNEINLKIQIEKSYYHYELFLDEKNRIMFLSTSKWSGYSDTSNKIELRKPAIIIPEKMISILDEIKLPYIVVNEPKDFFIWFLSGGHAIITEEMVSKFLSGSLDPSPSIQVGKAGFKPMEDLTEAIFNRAPSKKKRMEILDRDKRKCQYCGRSPNNNTDIELHLHHIKPFGIGGLTHPDNLITLCHTCHSGLEPHYNFNLYDILENQDGNKNIQIKYIESIKKYREVAKEIIENARK